MAFTMCDVSDYVTACFLFIQLAVDGEIKFLVYVMYCSFTISWLKKPLGGFYHYIK